MSHFPQTQSEAYAGQLALRPGWGPREVALLVACSAFALFFFVGAIGFPASQAFDDDSPEIIVASILASELWKISTVLLAYLLVRKSGGTWQDLGLRPPGMQARSVAGLVIGGFLAAELVVVSYSLMVTAFDLGPLEPGPQLPDEVFNTAVVTALVGISVVVNAPVLEELIFRGFIFTGLRRSLPLIPAGLLSGLIFAIPHGQVGLLLPFSLIGFIFAYAYARSGSLFVPIGIHFLFNLSSYIALVLLPEAR